MPVSVEFHFDFGSPNAYLSHAVIPAIEARTGVAFRYVPVLLGGVFKATNNVSPMVSLQGVKNKPEYQRLETARFVRQHGIRDFRANPHFPVNTLQIMRGAVFAEREGLLAPYVDAVYRHMWAEPKKMDDPEVIFAALGASDLPAERIMAGTQAPDVKSALDRQHGILRAAGRVWFAELLRRRRAVLRQGQAARRGRGDRTPERLGRPLRRRRRGRGPRSV